MDQDNCFQSTFDFISLTSEDTYMYSDEKYTMWLDDSECQENLFDIMLLTPEESFVEDNHIKTHIRLFFEELGYLTEEPEPIDPTRDYEAEAKILFASRNLKTRQKHICLSDLPSLDHFPSSSSSSSIPAQSIQQDFSSHTPIPLHYTHTDNSSHVNTAHFSP
ncbi:hypothetical protein J3Q64DRAFT_1730810 [Phycomyces blakesleeanus]|uniref:Uncharacterized protein n=2 Tax=Phycomyces blakesleeanus TaxID=4837 RepID=A0A163AL84_PHYB8|nr:hypothetical protein PHYBLDRAFT_80095 [Phycomyces blakesleeanus NRRL 1555(-)]OAD74271.1 hypothetical protein PHYBLDRAFT_80095 [Phycomyces blakesleeanus NRRL 1555(-)]|eukprot:XP_018292311.1 hypothetical protein PHYBLDRAFT_80095 [Phycomyces blakesleeanus NRRL 1555(-)]